jgi:hypothetical protein
VLKTGIVALIGILSIGIASAQMTPEEAMQKLQERQAAATQPDDLQSEIHTLKAVIADQAKQIDALKLKIAQLQAENSMLKKQVAANPLPAVEPSPTVQPKSTFGSRMREYVQGQAQLGGRSFYRMVNAQSDIALADEVDAGIDDYAKTHNISPEIVAQMHEGDPKPGMPEDALSSFLTLQLVSEGEHLKIYKAEILRQRYSQMGKTNWRIITRDGKVSMVTDADSGDDTNTTIIEGH